MEINVTVDNLLDLIKIHSFEESLPGFILSINTLLMLESQPNIPATHLIASGYHAIFGIAALASPYIPENVIGIMDLKKVETLRRTINLAKNENVFVRELNNIAKPGLFLYEDEQYLMLETLEEKLKGGK